MPSQLGRTRSGLVAGGSPYVVMDYIDGDEVMFEYAPMQRLAADGQLMAFRHESFWQCMDNPREMEQLNKMWAEGQAPWKVW